MNEIVFLKEQNPWWIAKERILEDVNLEILQKVKYEWVPIILDTLNLEKDIIYTMRGSRQSGKTTAMKLLIKRLLPNHPKENIFYCTCNNIDDYHQLIDVLKTYLDWAGENGRKYIFIDEITFVKDWTRGIKHLADLGRLRNCTLLLTGSNAHDLKYEIERLPGRRGQDPELDKIFSPLSFREYIGLVDPGILSGFSDMDSARKNYPLHKEAIERHLSHYSLSGGFIHAINGFAAEKKISVDIYQQYLSWILGDLAKLGRKESYSRQIFDQIIRSITTNVGFDTIAKKTSIDSHVTVAEYLDVMESNFITKILYQIDMNKKMAASRKTKKIYFQDIFLLWVFWGFVLGIPDYFSGSRTRLEDPSIKGKLIENLIMSYLMRLENSVNWGNIVFFFRTDNMAEVDFVVKRPDGGLLPLEVKYQNKVGERDFLHLNKINRDKGVIISKDTFWNQGDKWIIPAPVFLLMPVEHWITDKL